MKKLKYILLAITMMVVAFYSEAQQLTLTSEYALSTDTVVNTATSYLQNTTPLKSRGIVTVTVVAVKNSGTVGGTISLQGSIDAVNYKAMSTVETQTALATITATDGSTNYAWRLSDNYFPYYRVSWVGTGTMSATFSGKILVKK